ncbi:glycine cleavage system protein GcvH [Acidiferrobacter sp.]|uniref:glycine cleavage system protein GcvH n=1 Tax=Acidiferrobacter sp. TaxID=1872107 RepID=UPI00261C1744|nr:glycine cleavage system protein GcvH [Acidiferrobacter sp.]
MSKVPGDLRYTKSHEWVRVEGQALVVGITDHAQDLMGDMVFIELPRPGTRLAAGKECAVVESVKAASDVYAPVAGEVTMINEALANAPETLNTDPYGNGWLFTMKPADPASLQGLLDAPAYEALLASEA